MATHSNVLAWRIPWTEKSLVGYNPWGHKESDTTEQLSLTGYLCILSALYCTTSSPLPVAVKMIEVLMK